MVASTQAADHGLARADGQERHRRADAEQVAFKLMVWPWKVTDEQRGGLSHGNSFVRIDRGWPSRGLDLAGCAGVPEPGENTGWVENEASASCVN